MPRRRITALLSGRRPVALGALAIGGAVLVVLGAGEALRESNGTPVLVAGTLLVLVAVMGDRVKEVGAKVGTNELSVTMREVERSSELLHVQLEQLQKADDTPNTIRTDLANVAKTVDKLRSAARVASDVASGTRHAYSVPDWDADNVADKDGTVMLELREPGPMRGSGFLLGNRARCTVVAPSGAQESHEVELDNAGSLLAARRAVAWWPDDFPLASERGQHRVVWAVPDVAAAGMGAMASDPWVNVALDSFIA